MAIYKFLRKHLLISLVVVMAISVFGLANNTNYFKGDVNAVSATALSDLTIAAQSGSAIYLDSSSKLTVVHANIGTADVASDTKGSTYIYIYKNSDGSLYKTWTYSWSTLSDKSFLKAGSYSKIQPQTLDSSNYTVKACIDPTSVVSESNESNNCKTINLSTALPDLKVSNVYLSGSTLSIEVKNEGTADVSSDTKGSTYIYIDGVLKWTYSWSTLSDKSFLKAGGTSTMQPQTLSGKHTIKACVDSTYIVTESDESDNCKEATLGTDETKSDLIVSEIKVNSNNYLQFTIKNQGAKDAYIDSNSTVSAYHDDVFNNTYGFSGAFYLKQNETTTINAAKLSKTTKVKACINAASSISESDATNNCKTTTITISTALPDLKVNNVYLSGSTLSIEVKNEGNADVASDTKGSTYIYIDGVLKWTYSWSTLSDKSFLKAGGTSTMQPQTLSGKHTVKACVDSTYIVTESDESDNCKEATLGSSESDTEITSTPAADSSDNVYIKVGDTITFYDPSTWPSNVTGWRWDYDSSILSCSTSPYEPKCTGLKAGTTNVYLTYTYSNNTTSRSNIIKVNVSSTTTSTTYPDLKVSNIWLEGSMNYLTISLANEGDKDVPSDTDGGTYIYIDGTLVWTYGWSSFSDVNFLKVGGYTIMQPQTLSGKHTIKACVDSTYIVTESDESNNCKEVILDTSASSATASNTNDTNYMRIAPNGATMKPNSSYTFTSYVETSTGAVAVNSNWYLGDESLADLQNCTISSTCTVKAGSKTGTVQLYANYYQYASSVSIAISNNETEYEDEVDTNTNDNPFSDTDMNTLYGKAAADLYYKAIIGGFSDGTFRGYNEVNRAEAAKFLLLAKGINVSEISYSRFSDVDPSAWYAKYVEKAAELGIISGYSDGTFRPANTINTAEFLKMLTLTFNLQTNLSYSYKDVDSGAWYAQYVGIAPKYNLFPDRTNGYLYPTAYLTRYEVAVAIYEYLINK